MSRSGTGPWCAATDGVFILYTDGPDPDRRESDRIVKAVERDTGMCFASSMIKRCRGSGDLGEEYGRFLVETYEHDGRLPPGSTGRAFVRDVTIDGVRRVVVVVLQPEFHSWIRGFVPRHLAGARAAAPALADRPGFIRLIGEPALSFVASAWDDDFWRLDDVEIRVNLFACSDPARIRELIPDGDYQAWVKPWVDDVVGRGSDAAHWLVCADTEASGVHLGYFAGDRTTAFLPWDLLPTPGRRRTRRFLPAGDEQPPMSDVDASDAAAQVPAPVAHETPPEAGEHGRPAPPPDGPGPGPSAVEAWRVGDVVADLYDVRAVIRTGGMGVIHRVWHRDWQVELAVKTPRPELLNSAASVRSFEEEAEAWVALGVHPNTVTCAYVRQMGGVPRVFAEWVDGGTLADAIHDRTLYRGEEQQVLSRLLDIVIQFARGLEHAHDKGLVHQDVKPANVMLAGDGTIKVTDFGLARAYGQGPGKPPPEATVQVGYGGARTIGYCSPEQAQAAGDPTVRLSRATDVWSWAISVWQLFVGEPPCRYGQTAADLFAASLAERRVVAGIPPLPPQLAAALTRCFAEDPAERPRMADLAAELVASYAGVTGEQYPRPRPDPATPPADGLSDHALSLLDLGRPDRADELWLQARAADPGHLHTVYNHGLRRWRLGLITDAQLISELERARDRHPPDPLGDHLLGLVHLEQGDVSAARAHLERAARRAPDDSDVSAALGLARDRPVEPDPLVLVGHSDAVHDVSISGDGRVAASGSADGTIHLWDLRTGRCRHTLTTRAGVAAVALSSAGSRVIACDAAAALTVWDADTGRPLHRLGTVSARSLAISADGAVAVTAGPAAVQVWDIDRGRLVRTLGPEDADLLSAAVSVGLTTDGRLAVAFYAVEGRTRIWEVGSGRLLHVLDAVGSGAFDASSGEFVSATEPARLWSGPATVRAAASCRRLSTPSVPGHRITETSALSTAGDRLVVIGPSFPLAVEVWELHPGRCLRSLSGHTEPITSLASSADGRVVVSGGRDRTVRVWRPSPAGPAASWRLSRAWLGG